MKRALQHHLPTRALALVLFVAVLAGCGGGAPTAAQPVPVPAAVTQSPPTPTQPPPTPAPSATSIPPTPSPVPTRVEPTDTVAPTQLPPPTVPATEVATAQADTPPAPADAADVNYDAAAGELTYTSPSDIKTLAEFYRKALPAGGWQEVEEGTIVTDNVGTLVYTRGDAGLSVIMARSSGAGPTAVTITTTGVLARAGQESGATPAAAEGSGGDLKAQDKDGLPVPDDYTEYVGESSPFRRGLTAVSPSGVGAVLALYRRELAARQWHELPATVAPTEAAADLMFESVDQGRLALKLTQNARQGTDISATIKMDAAAKKAGILPASGKARIYLGNATSGEVTFSINQKEFKVGTQDPTSGSMAGVPYADLAPGQYDFTLTQPGNAPVKDQITVGPDETWGLLAGPGGALPVQLY